MKGAAKKLQVNQCAYKRYENELQVKLYNFINFVQANVLKRMKIKDASTSSTTHELPLSLEIYRSFISSDLTSEEQLYLHIPLVTEKS